MKKAFAIIAFGLIVLAGSTPEIVRMHTKTDQEMIEFGKEFASVCKVGQDLGDGTLISDEWVLTAAHVASVLFEPQESQHVYFDGKSRKILEIIIHPQYSSIHNHDIALIRIETAPVKFSPSPIYTKLDETGKDIVIVGHGYAKAGDSRAWEHKDGIKRAATNKIERTTSNQIIFNFSHPDSPDATSLEGTAGPGDSGGPAFLKMDGTHYVAGVSSAGMDGRNGPGTYGAIEHYTRVSSYTDWIQSYTDQ